ncbi:RNA-directed DNA polymerase [Antricoccus suffuscus]|uniref:RNA-directed DNA polymerase n=1 Tax=Antricoccus suffuscus TaxID=1629062 RepID=A0A2T1A380_9ACTN|nr:reverse transcriptase family protein [Antricoccus suffuscus]PRZ43060.1 RNA-directed DNA polymerase [Antricoccus suffuscus]
MRKDLATALAGAFLSGEWTSSGLFDSAVPVVQGPTPWLPALIRQILAVYPAAPLDRSRELAVVIGSRPAAGGAKSARPIAWPAATTQMTSNPWHLPALHGLGDLAEMLDLGATELAWFTDPRHWARSTTDRRLRHYRVTTKVAASGAVRVLEAPKYRLKSHQRRFLTEILDRIPAHDAAHGFRAGRSVASYAAPHGGQPVVVRMDLEGFFASITAGRVYGILRSAGYPEPVAHALTGLATTVLPRAEWNAISPPANPDLREAHWRLGRRLAGPHLPQGAPTSPALANLAAHRLDVRLSALASSWGGRYTRYADDLALSGGIGWRGDVSRLVALVGDIVRDEGFRLNDRKTAVLPAHSRQVLGGLVVNERPHVSRAEVDLLRAVLHNCRRDGPSTQNRAGVPDFEGHLRGRIAWVAQHDPARGARLRALFDAIDWSF